MGSNDKTETIKHLKEVLDVVGKSSTHPSALTHKHIEILNSIIKARRRTEPIMFSEAFKVFESCPKPKLSSDPQMVYPSTTDTAVTCFNNPQLAALNFRLTAVYAKKGMGCSPFSARSGQFFRDHASQTMPGAIFRKIGASDPTIRSRKNNRSYFLSDVTYLYISSHRPMQLFEIVRRLDTLGLGSKVFQTPIYFDTGNALAFADLADDIEEQPPSDRYVDLRSKQVFETLTVGDLVKLMTVLAESNTNTTIGDIYMLGGRCDPVEREQSNQAEYGPLASLVCGVELQGDRVVLHTLNHQMAKESVTGYNYVRTATERWMATERKYNVQGYDMGHMSYSIIEEDLISMFNSAPLQTPCSV